MCGRFVGFRNIEQLKAYFPIDVENCETVTNYNVAPSQMILAIARIDGLNSCTIITREAIGPIQDIHHRMPVILEPNEYDFWLDIENQDIEELQKILQTKFVSELASYPVDKKVNSVQNNHSSNLEPVQLEFDF